MFLSPWELFVIDQVKKEQDVDTVARHLANHYSGNVDYATFRQACWECRVDPDDFQQEDLETLQEKLNRM